MKIAKASTNNEELTYLRKLISNHWDITYMNQYKDWCNKNYQNKYIFLRDYIPAISSQAKQLPEASAFSKAWRDIVGITLQQELRDENFNYTEGKTILDLQEKLQQMCNACLRIITHKSSDDQFSVGSSKLGGYPDLPEGFQWPKYDGHYIGFRGQLNLSDIQQTVIADQLPRAGLLSIFIYENEEDSSPGGHGEPGGHQVVYFPPETKLYRSPADFDFIDGNQISPACMLELVETYDIQCPYDQEGSLRFSQSELERIGYDDDMEIYDAINNMNGSYSTRHSKLFGYGHAGRYFDDPVKDGWIHLLSLISDENLEWCWADEHEVFISIHPERMKVADFSSTDIRNG